MKHDINIAHCSQLLKQITDDIATAAPSHAVNPTIQESIARVKIANVDADLRLRSAMQALYPDISWRDEESAGFDIAAPHWVYDPIDGAYHYLQGLPLWSASLALVQDGRAIIAMVYDPALKEMFIGVEGGGATCSCRALQVSPKTELGWTVVGTAIAPRLQVGAEMQAEALRLLTVIAPQVFVIRPMAATSLQLAYVASGRLDAYWETGNDPSDWLAGALLVQEAGGEVSDLGGGSLQMGSRGIVAGNKVLAHQLRQVAALTAVQSA